MKQEALNIGEKSHHIKSENSQQYEQLSLWQNRNLTKNLNIQQKENSQIEDINTNILQLEKDKLQDFILTVLQKLPFFHTFALKRFKSFLRDIHNGYEIHNNKFHNFSHGVSVMHTCYLLATTPSASKILSPFQIFSVVFSGLCHDVGHTGFNNDFQIKTKSEKALTYQNCSPLENFHAAYSFELLAKEENNFFQGMAQSQFSKFKKNVVSNILFTDMKQHFSLLKDFKALQKPIAFESQLNTFTAMLVHTSDFGGSAKDFEVCQQWSFKVNEQFMKQFKMEAQLGLPQTPFMKDLEQIAVISKNETGFLKGIVLPLFSVMQEFLDYDEKCKIMKQHVQRNAGKWQQINQKAISEQ